MYLSTRSNSLAIHEYCSEPARLGGARYIGVNMDASLHINGPIVTPVSTCLLRLLINTWHAQAGNYILNRQAGLPSLLVLSSIHTPHRGRDIAR